MDNEDLSEGEVCPVELLSSPLQQSSYFQYTEKRIIENFSDIQSQHMKSEHLWQKLFKKYCKPNQDQMKLRDFENFIGYNQIINKKDG